MEGTPPEEVTAGSVRVRRWRLEDTPHLHALLLANLEHLRPWMGWVAAEPLSFEERRSKIAASDTRWEVGEDYSYAIVVDASGELLGGCGLNRRIAPDALELGYWVRGDRTGQGIATDAARALVEAAFSIDGITHVEIHHDAANAASRRIPEKLGFTCIGERRDGVDAPAEVGIDVVWRLDRDPAQRCRTAEFGGTGSGSRHQPSSGAAGLTGMEGVRHRPAVVGDVHFLATMLGEAAVWRPDKPTPTGDEVMADPQYAMYLADWPRPGDFGLVAEQDDLVGAAWYRTYTEADHGYGFVAEDVPELAIAVVAGRRHEGIGRRLLVDLIEASITQGYAAISLSVREHNPARRLYESTGFVLSDRHGTSWTMIRHANRNDAR